MSGDIDGPLAGHGRLVSGDRINLELEVQDPPLQVTVDKQVEPGVFEQAAEVRTDADGFLQDEA